MFQLPRKFVAVLLAVWLPMFSGYALADSIVMQSMKGDCHGAQQVSNPSQQVSNVHQHMHHVQPGASEHQSAGLHDSQSPTCNDHCGVCQIACSGYLAAVIMVVIEAQPSSQSFTLVSTQFQSFTSAPLVPPPLALA